VQGLVAIYRKFFSSTEEYIPLYFVQYIPLRASG